MKLIKTLIIMWAFSVQAGLPPTTLSGQSSANSPTTFKFKTPYSQSTVTPLGGLIETGNENMLLNPNFEAPTLSGWTCTTGTCTVESTIFSSGKQSAKIVPSANIFDFSQQISTSANIQKQGVMGIVYNFPATCTTASVQTIVDGVAQTTVPTTSLILDGAFHSIEIPTTFGATSAKIRAFSTASCTGNIYIDKAYISQGIGFQNLMLDNVYSAKISSGCVISGENITGWVSGCSGTTTKALTFKSGIFSSVAPVCTATVNVGRSIQFSTASTTGGISVQGFDDAGTPQSYAFDIHCQKSGNDYLASSVNVYSSTNGNYSRTAYTPTFTGFGTPSSVSCYHSREGEFLSVDCYFVSGTTTGVSAGISLPNSLLASASMGTLTSRGHYALNSANSFSGEILAEPSSGTLSFGQQAVGATATASKQVASTLLSSGTVVTFFARIPISGWSNSNIILGSFAGVPAVPGYQGNVDTFSLHYAGATQSAVCAISPCNIYNQIGNAVSSITRSGSGNNTMFFAKTYAKINCSITSANNGSSIINTYTAVTAANTSSLNFITMNGLAVGTDGFGTIMCQGSY